MIFKKSFANDGICKQVTPYDKLNQDGITINCTYTYVGADKNKLDNTGKSLFVLDYLIEVGDKLNNNGIVTPHDCEGKTKITDRFIQQQKDEIASRLVNGSTLDKVVNSLPFYFKTNNVGKYKFTSGCFRDYEVTVTPNLNLGLFNGNETDGFTATEELTTLIVNKAKIEAKKISNDILKCINKEVSGEVSMTTKDI